MNQGLLFLQTADFFIDAGIKGPILCNNIKGYSLILFYSTACHHCQNILPLFKRLPERVLGCHFGMVNISNNKDIIAMSEKTTSPIKYVPFIILYIHGKPYMRYDYEGEPSTDSMMKFVVQVLSKFQSKEKEKFVFSGNNNQSVQQQKQAVPMYTTGKPLYGFNDEFYRQFENAYGKNK